MSENRIDAVHGELCIITNEGKIVLEPKVDIDALYYPSHGYCQVEKNGKFGYIDMQGDLVIPFRYDQAYPFSENGLAFVVGENGLGGYIDQHNEYIIEPVYDSGSMFKFGFAAVSRDGKYKYIYKNGSKAINSEFQYAGGFSECGLAKVVEFNGKHGLMSTTSRVVLGLKEGCELLEFKEDSRITKFRSNGRKALINAAGDIITGFYDEIVISPYAKLHPFLQNGYWGYMDDKGQEVIPASYLEASEFTEDGIASVKTFHPFAENNIWELHINEKDEIVDEQLIQSNAKRFTDRFAQVSRFKKSIALAARKGEEPLLQPARQTTELDNEEETCWEVYITLYDKNIEAITEFIKNEIGDRKILDIGNGHVTLLWTLLDWESPGDIENELYYVLRNGELGDYDYRIAG